MSDFAPALGRIVHYVSQGSPILSDGTQVYSSTCRAGLITETAPGSSVVSLAVINPTGFFFREKVVEDGETGEPGTWHWFQQCPGHRRVDPDSSR